MLDKEITEEPQTLNEVVWRCVRAARDSLPPSWSSATELEPALGNADALVRVSSPDGVESSLIFEAKRLLERRDVPALIAQLSRLIESYPSVAEGVVAARYLAPSVRQELSDRGVSYVDATGNMRIVLSRPGLFISVRGADKDPWRGPGRPRGSLKGPPAAKVVRALADFRGPWRIRELIDISKASTGATYRVVDYLEREGLLSKTEGGELILNNWRSLLREWGKDYGFSRSNRVTRYIEPRGLPELMKNLANFEDQRYAVTGSLAAAEWAPYAPARTAQIYVENAAEAARLLRLRPAEAGVNVLLAEPETYVVFDRAVTNPRGITTVAPTQAAVDLLAGPGRNPAEAEELMDWMERNEPSWRV